MAKPDQVSAAEPETSAQKDAETSAAGNAQEPLVKNESPLLASPKDRAAVSKDGDIGATNGVGTAKHKAAQGKEKPKKRKLIAACVYCRRSHMICDAGRPCQRCIKRNIGHLCHDEPTTKKKKGKGSQSPTARSASVSRSGSVPVGTNGSSDAGAGAGVGAAGALGSGVDGDAQAQAQQQQQQQQQFGVGVSQQPQPSSQRFTHVPEGVYKPDAQQALTGADVIGQQQQPAINSEAAKMLNPASAAINQRPFFYSEHAGSEFNSLTEFLSMIDDTDVINTINMHNDPMLHKLEANSALTYSQNNSSTNLQAQLQQASRVTQPQSQTQTQSQTQHQQQPQNQQVPLQQAQFDSTFFNSLPSGKSALSLNGGQSQTSLVNGFPQTPQTPSVAQTPTGATPNALGSTTPGIGLAAYNNNFQRTGPAAVAIPQHVQSQQSNAAAGATPYVSDAARDKFFLTAADPTTEISPEERLKQVINAKLEAGLLKPYNYAKGYQRLQNYMDNHMAVSSRQRILKPLSTFRPGFRAIAKSLKDIDLILVEENFERMLLDYDRVFTSMAIPACLWRRTGEIYRGNKEFASLVEVSIDDLKNGKLTIYELMTEESSVNFWEKYGAIAFDKTQKAVLTSCNLRTKDGLRKKNCCFSFTIRRDRYNIPSCIVGNFIPIQ